MKITTHDNKRMKISKVIRTTEDGRDYQLIQITLYKSDDSDYPYEEIDIYSKFGIGELPVEVEEVKDEREKSN